MSIIYVGGYVDIYNYPKTDGSLILPPDWIDRELPLGKPIPLNIEHSQSAVVGYVPGLFNFPDGLFCVGVISSGKFLKFLDKIYNSSKVAKRKSEYLNLAPKLQALHAWLPELSLSSLHPTANANVYGRGVPGRTFNHVALCALGRRRGTVAIYAYDLNWLLDQFPALTRENKNAVRQAALACPDFKQKVNFTPDTDFLLGKAIDASFIKNRVELLTSDREVVGLNKKLTYLKASESEPTAADHQETHHCPPTSCILSEEDNMSTDDFISLPKSAFLHLLQTLPHQQATAGAAAVGNTQQQQQQQQHVCGQFGMSAFPVPFAPIQMTNLPPSLPPSVSSQHGPQIFTATGGYIYPTQIAGHGPLGGQYHNPTPLFPPIPPPSLTVTQSLPGGYGYGYYPTYPAPPRYGKRKKESSSDEDDGAFPGERAPLSDLSKSITEIQDQLRDLRDFARSSREATSVSAAPTQPPWGLFYPPGWPRPPGLAGEYYNTSNNNAAPAPAADNTTSSPSEVKPQMEQAAPPPGPAPTPGPIPTQAQIPAPESKPATSCTAEDVKAQATKVVEACMLNGKPAGILQKIFCDELVGKHQ